MWKSAKAALRVWPTLWVKGGQVATRVRGDIRLAYSEELYGPVACKKDLEEVEREADDRYAGNPGQRPLPKTPTKSLKAGSYLTAEYESGSSKFSISFIWTLSDRYEFKVQRLPVRKFLIVLLPLENSFFCWMIGHIIGRR